MRCSGKQKNSRKYNSGNGTTDFTVTSSSSYSDNKSNNTDGNTSTVNKDKSPNVLESRKTPDNKNKGVFILGHSVVKHMSGYDIFRQIKNCKVYIKGFSGVKTECMKGLCSTTTNKRKPRSHIDSR